MRLGKLGEIARKASSKQLQLDSVAVSDVQLNLNCRDEIIPILRGLQEIYQQAELRDGIPPLKLMTAESN